MKHLPTCLATLFVAAASPAAWAMHPIPLPDFTVFVDKPTGFAFVKLPDGWKFVGRLDARDVERLPSNANANVVTALMERDPSDDEADRLRLANGPDIPPEP